MTNLTERHEALAAESQWDFSDLRALFINCTLKRSPEASNTRGLADLAVAIMERNGVSGRGHPGRRPPDRDRRLPGHDRARLGATTTGRRSSRRCMAADILVLLSPIWLGEKSSVCTQVIERLYGNSHLLNDAGQWAYYGRVGGCMITGNEDGAKHCAMNILYSLQHLGYVDPTASRLGMARAKPAPDPAISIPAPAAPRTTSPTATRPSSPGTSCTSRG